MKARIVVPVAIVVAFLALLTLVFLSEGERLAHPSIYPSVAAPPDALPSQVDAALAKLQWGHAAFDTPTEMQLEEPRILELVLSGASTAKELKSQLRSAAGAEVARVQLSSRMEASLKGVGFSIEPLAPEVQAVASRGITRWRWAVTPVDSGRRYLHLTLSAHLRVDGEGTLYVVRTFERSIEVRVTVGQRVTTFVSENWQWLWTTLLVPLAALAPRAWRRLRGHASAARPGRA